MVSPFAGPKIKFVIFQCEYLTGKSYRGVFRAQSNIQYRFFAKIVNGFQLLFYFLHLRFLLRTFTIHRAEGEGGGYLFNTSLPLLSTSQTLRCQLGNCHRELTSTHIQQPDSNREPLVSERKSLNSNLRALKLGFQLLNIFAKKPHIRRSTGF